jgi:hypothetical protein
LSSDEYKEITGEDYPEGAPVAAGLTDVIIAEGYGRIHLSKENEVFFNWRVPYKNWISEGLAHDKIRGECCPIDLSVVDEENLPLQAMYMDIDDLEFFGKEDVISDELKQELVNKLFVCGTPFSIAEGMPTFQSPICMAEYHAITKRSINQIEESSPGVKSNEPDSSDDYAGLRERLSQMISNSDQEGISALLDSVTGFWNIGHTVYTRIKTQQVNDTQPKS